jgi:hypothetical protein
MNPKDMDISLNERVLTIKGGRWRFKDLLLPALLRSVGHLRFLKERDRFSQGNEP